MKASDIDISGLDDDEAMSLVLRINREHGFSGTLFTRADAESQAGRDLTDDEWEKVQSAWGWRKGLQEILCERGWSLIDDALHDAGVTKVEQESA